MAGKFGVDISHVENIKNCGIRLPVLGKVAWLGIEVNGVGIVRPLQADVLDKLGVPLPVFAAIFSPIQDKLWNSVLDKAAVDAAAFENVECIATGLPVGSHGLGMCL
ncbi:MAG: hypothetical protein ACI9OO_000144, partial [Bacteroidia bacterium]